MVFSFPYFLSSWRIVGRVHFRWNVDQQKRIYVRQYFVRQKKQIAIRSCSGQGVVQTNVLPNNTFGSLQRVTVLGWRHEDYTLEPLKGAEPESS